MSEIRPLGQPNIYREASKHKNIFDDCWGTKGKNIDLSKVDFSKIKLDGKILGEKEQGMIEKTLKDTGLKLNPKVDLKEQFKKISETLDNQGKRALSGKVKALVDKLINELKPSGESQSKDEIKKRMKDWMDRAKTDGSNGELYKPLR